jgi:hypothetical protein
MPRPDDAACDRLGCDSSSRREPDGIADRISYPAPRLEPDRGTNQRANQRTDQRADLRSAPNPRAEPNTESGPDTATNSNPNSAATSAAAFDLVLTRSHQPAQQSAHRLRSALRFGQGDNDHLYSGWDDWNLLLHRCFRRQLCRRDHRPRPHAGRDGDDQGMRFKQCMRFHDDYGDRSLARTLQPGHLPTDATMWRSCPSRSAEPVEPRPSIAVT